MSAPGLRVRSVLQRVCREETMARVIDPVIADLQRECMGASVWGRRAVLVRGYLALVKVLVVLWPRTLRRGVLSRLDADQGALGRTVAVGGGISLLLGLAATLPAFFAWLRFDTGQSWKAALFMMLIPSVLPLTVPLGVLIGVCAGLHGRPMTRGVRRRTLGLAVATSVSMWMAIVWVIPESNQIFREATAGGRLERGLAEGPVSEIRVRARELQQAGRADSATRLLVDYHVRWALCGLVLASAVFGLGVCARYRRADVKTAVVLTVTVLYALYMRELINGPGARSEAAVIAVVWMPAVIIGATGWLLLNLRSEGSSAAAMS